MDKRIRIIIDRSIMNFYEESRCPSFKPKLKKQEIRFARIKIDRSEKIVASSLKSIYLFTMSAKS